MVVSKHALLRVFALAVILVGAAWQSARAEEAATQHASDSGNCARSAFQVLIDVGHTATSPGADSARGREILFPMRGIIWAYAFPGFRHRFPRASQEPVAGC